VPLSLHETTVDQLWDAMRSPTHSEDDVLGQCGEELMVMVTGKNRQGEKKHEPDNTWLVCLTKRVELNLSSDQFVILLSGGGNDIADKNLPDFLNDISTSNEPVKNDEFNKAIGLLKEAYLTIFKTLSDQFSNKKFHFVMHGYGYPPVNGRGVITAFENSSSKKLQSLSPGPWLKPHFVEKGITDRPLQEKIIGDFIDTFNDMLTDLVKENNLPNVTLYYADLLQITDQVNRNPGWCNELHFDHSSYVEAAKKVYKIIQPLL